MKTTADTETLRRSERGIEMEAQVLKFSLVAFKDMLKERHA